MVSYFYKVVDDCDYGCNHQVSLTTKIVWMVNDTLFCQTLWYLTCRACCGKGIKQKLQELQAGAVRPISWLFKFGLKVLKFIFIYIEVQTLPFQHLKVFLHLLILIICIFWIEHFSDFHLFLLNIIFIYDGVRWRTILFFISCQAFYSSNHCIDADIFLISKGSCLFRNEWTS